MSYGRKRILSSWSLRVSPGEVVRLVIENGAGKTTLIKGILINSASKSANVPKDPAVT